MPLAKPTALFALLLMSGVCVSNSLAQQPADPAPSPAPAAPATQESADGDVEAEVRALLPGLATRDSTKRQQAEDELVELGEPAKAVIERVLESPEADNVEVRTRLESAILRIDADRLTGPSYVTLRLKDAKPADAFSELSKQGSAEVRTFPDDLWQQGEWPAITLDLRRQPFWAAAQELADKTGVGFQAWNDGLRLVRGPGQIGGPSVVSGPFLVVATQVSRAQTIVLGKDGGPAAGGVAARPPLVRARSNEFGVLLLVMPEPKLSVVRAATGVRLERAEDDRGNDLIPPVGAGGQSYAGGMGGAWSVFARLNYPAANAGQRIVKLAGSATFVVQTKSEQIEIPTPLKLKDAFRLVGGSRVTFQEMTQSGDRFELKVTLTPDGNAAGGGGADGMASLLQSVQTRLRILDAAGEPLDRRGMSSQGNGRETKITLHFAPRGGPNAAGEGDPTRLVWDVPTETKDVEVPFEFADLPMP